MHRVRRYRFVLIVLLALCAIWQPVLLAASETHEADHAIQTGHAHDDEHVEHGIPDDDPLHDHDPLHGLMHLGQCCAFPTAMSADAHVVALELGHAAPPTATTMLEHPVFFQPLLRPPIAG